MVRGDVILNQEKYTDVECFRLSSLVGNIIQIEVSFHVDVSALVGSKLCTKIPRILTLRGPERQILLPQGEFKELYLAGSCSINKKSRVSWWIGPQHKII